MDFELGKIQSIQFTPLVARGHIIRGSWVIAKWTNGLSLSFVR